MLQTAQSRGKVCRWSFCAVTRSSCSAKAKPCRQACWSGCKASSMTRRASRCKHHGILAVDPCSACGDNLVVQTLSAKQLALAKENAPGVFWVEIALGD